MPCSGPSQYGNFRSWERGRHDHSHLPAAGTAGVGGTDGAVALRAPTPGPGELAGLGLRVGARLLRVRGARAVDVRVTVDADRVRPVRPLVPHHAARPGPGTS